MHCQLERLHHNISSYLFYVSHFHADCDFSACTATSFRPDYKPQAAPKNRLGVAKLFA